MIRPFGNSFDRLLDNAQRLPHLDHAHDVPVIGIAVFAGGNFKVEILIVGIGLRFAQVPLHAAGAKYRAGHAQRDAILAGNFADTFGAFEPDAIGGEQLFVFVDLRLHERNEILHVPFESVVRFILQSADAKSMRGEPSAAILFENLENLFAVAEGIEQRRDRADIERVRAQPELVAGDAVQLSEDDSNILRARGRFDAE